MIEMSANSLESRVSNLESQVSMLNTELTAIQTMLTAIDSSLASIESQLTALSGLGIQTISVKFGSNGVGSGVIKEQTVVASSRSIALVISNIQNQVSGDPFTVRVVVDGTTVTTFSTGKNPPFFDIFVLEIGVHDVQIVSDNSDGAALFNGDIFFIGVFPFA